eukprot:COSAG02_NODE_1826_length_10754_cov_4.509714_4_plen_59_part_00
MNVHRLDSFIDSASEQNGDKSTLMKDEKSYLARETGRTPPHTVQVVQKGGLPRRWIQC